MFGFTLFNHICKPKLKSVPYCKWLTFFSRSIEKKHLVSWTRHGASKSEKALCQSKAGRKLNVVSNSGYKLLIQGTSGGKSERVTTGRPAWTNKHQPTKLLLLLEAKQYRQGAQSVSLTTDGEPQSSTKVSNAEDHWMDNMLARLRKRQLEKLHWQLHSLVAERVQLLWQLI